jgi:ribosomal protein L11 methyltransferase
VSSLRGDERPDDEPRFPFLLVDVDEADADEASALLFELGASGVEERDATTLVKGTAGKRTLVAAFESHEEAQAALGAVDASWAGRIEEIVGDAWRDAWKAHFRPFVLCPGVVVRPPWETYERADGISHVIELEPGRAFGTGLHETTSLVTEALAAHPESFRDRAVLDVGCGSGILAIVALVLGASRARAIDNDPDVIDVVKENAERNGLVSRIETDATPVEDLQETFDTVVANIEADVLTRLAKPIGARVNPGGLLVLSGVLFPQKERVALAYEDAFELLDTPQKGEWIALVFRRK